VAAAVNDINLDPTFADIDRSVHAILAPPGFRYWLWIGFLLALTLTGAGLWTNQIYNGLQVTGLGNPVMWAVYITNFVFWVGIAHSGTLISAILFLFRTRWRTAVYRAAETMTIFAVATAGLFPIIHLGRPWFFYWLAPYPNQRLCLLKTLSGMTRVWACGSEAADGRVSEPAAACYPVAIHAASAA
jgi:hypothetical protein